MKAIADVCLIPLGVGLSVSSQIAECEKIFKKYPLETKLHAYGTNLEGEWDDVMATNLRTAFAVVRAVAPAMGRTGGGSLVLMSSAAARVGLANHDAIAAAKAGVTGLALSAAFQLIPALPLYARAIAGLCGFSVAGGLFLWKFIQMAQEDDA